MPDTNGKAYGFNIITPIKRWRLWQLKLGFFLVSFFPAVLGDLKRCSFIYFARWVIIGRLPYFGAPQPKERLHYKYLMFCSNFNGGWQQYFDTFSDAIDVNINDIWQVCVGFPGARPVTPLKEYARANQYSCDYYYIAYPGATSTDIRCALHLQQELDDFERQHATAEAHGFAEQYALFLRRIQNDLGSTGLATPAA